MKLRYLSYCLLFFVFVKAHANITPNSLFSDHMVLQQGVTVPVWGNAAIGERVTIHFNGQTVSTIARKGKWVLSLKKLEAGGPFTMTIIGNDTVQINDIMVGEVWLCSGQSNMEMPVAGTGKSYPPLVDRDKEVAEADYPMIRQYHVPKKYATGEVADAGGQWKVCSPATVADFSAVGYFFARDLYKAIQVPVGILFSAYGGTPAEFWTSRAVLEKDPRLTDMVREYDKAVGEYPAKLEKYIEAMPLLYQQYGLDSGLAAMAGKPLPRKPAPPLNPSESRMIAGLYNGMIAPLIPFPIKGVCWYQGEANRARPTQYITLLTEMINSWRREWHEKKMPFLVVQVAPFKDMPPEIREAQLLVVKDVKNTALIVTTDCGDSANIHPALKQPVGYRLSLAARALAYDESIEYSGPMPHSALIKGAEVVLSFSHTGKGLTTADSVLTGFTIAGPNQKFLPAHAKISGKKIVLSNPEVPNPLHIRYGWRNVPDGNLFNLDGLPASPFRIDY